MKNTYIDLPERFFKRVNATKFPSPKLVAFNYLLSAELGLHLENKTDDELARIFSGQDLLPGSEPIALAYAGYQFGHPVPELGDGRALLLGEVNGFDIQLKGSGQTPFSRRGDGRSALGPVIREYIVSEAMHAMGVPTTRALCAVTTGEEVMRQNGLEPGGVFTRVAHSHIRVGTFQYFAFRNDKEALEILLDYTIKRHYPELLSLSSTKDKSLALLKQFSERQGELIAEWSALGFIHGVMNTDNCSLAGITIDYGPCAFMDEFRFYKVFSSIDERGRYAFFNQVPIAQWNVLRLADCLLPLIDENEEEAVRLVERELHESLHSFPEKRLRKLARKLGIEDYHSQDEKLVMEFLTYLEKESLDFTLAFRNLPHLYVGELASYVDNAELRNFVSKWQERVKKVDHLDEINPLYIPRNHQVQKAIEMSYQGNYEHFERLIKVLQNPYSFQKGFEEFSEAPLPQERIQKTFCGT